MPIWMEDAERNLTYENRAALAFVGRTLEEESGYGWMETVHPEDLERVREHYARTTRERADFTLEFRMRRFDGAWRHLLQIAIPRWGADGEYIGFLGVDVDVTELKLAAEHLTEAETRYRSLVASLQEGVMLQAADGQIVLANASAERILGLTAAELLQPSAFGLHGRAVRPDRTPLPREEHPATVTLRSGEALVGVLVGIHRPDGELRWLTVNSQPLYRPNEMSPYAVVVSFTDVTTQRRTLEALTASEQRYRMFIEQSTEGIWRYELDKPMPIVLAEDEQIRWFYTHGRLAECNGVMARMYGFEEPAELEATRLGDLLPADDPANIDYLREFIRAGYRMTDGESFERDREGRPRVMLNNLVGIVENGALVRVWGSQRDVTDRRTLEEEARQARKMETAGRLAGGIAHDFNNLLTAILGTSELLLKDLPPGSTAFSDVEDIKRAASRAANLTRQLLAFSRRQVLQPRVLDLNTLVQGTDRMLRRLIGEHILLETRVAPDLWRVRADPGQVEQVLLNLCVNARDALPRGGQILIETANVQFAGATHGPESVMPAGPFVRLKVSDTGTGMDPETLLHLFEPFFTTKAQGQGTGLGLATVYGIVKQSGGFIFADSAPGKGSAFRIYLPQVAEPADPADAAPSLSPSAPLAEGTVLLVEDEDAVRRLAHRVLSGAGYQVLEAANGAEALRRAGEHPGHIDVMVTDIIMPGMSGQELSERMLLQRPALKVLYVSGYTDDAILQHGTLLPNTAFLQKPFSPSALVARVGDVKASESHRPGGD